MTSGNISRSRILEAQGRVRGRWERDGLECPVGERSDTLARAAADGHLFEILAKPVHPIVMLDRAAHLLSPISPEAAKSA